MRNPVAFLEKAGDEWLDDFVYIARQPLIDRGYDIIAFDGADLEGTLLNKRIKPETDLIIGSVEATVAWFNECGIDVPQPLGYPDALKPYMGREVVETTLGELGDDYPYFVKPSGQVKLFTGDVVSRKEHLGYIRDNGATDETPVFKSGLIDFIAEFRCFIMKEGYQIRGIHHYKGKHGIFPNMKIVEEMVRAYKDCPSAYTLDVGVTSEGTTKLVEVNDMWAIGSYGFNSRDYALMCARRMREIYNNKKLEV